jgi:hypothetical protein
MPTIETPSPRLSPPRRPRGLCWLCAGLVAAGGANLVTALRAVRFADDYAALGVDFPAPVQVVWGLAWGIGLLWAALQLWRHRNGSLRWVLLVVVGYALAQIGWWRLFVRADYGLIRWPFAVLLTVLLVAWIIWYLNRPPVRALFRMQSSDSFPTETRGTSR